MRAIAGIRVVVRAGAAAASFVLMLAAGAASSQLAPRHLVGPQCAFNSDCAIGLVCAGGYCRAECRTNRDCAAAQVCRVEIFDDQGRFVRFPPALPANPGGIEAAAEANQSYESIPRGPGEHVGARCRVPVVQPAAGVIAYFRAADPVLKADVTHTAAKCPASVAFTGHITATGGSGPVTYRFVRSDGATGPVKTLKFGTPGTQRVTEAWTLGATTKGWLKLEVLTPNALASAQAPFTLDCAR
jgi:hypothetical protein